MSKNWIAGAIKHPGAMTAQADNAGVSNRTFATEHEHDSGKTGQRARLAKVLEGLHHKKWASE